MAFSAKAAIFPFIAGPRLVTEIEVAEAMGLGFHVRFNIVAKMSNGKLILCLTGVIEFLRRYSMLAVVGLQR